MTWMVPNALIVGLCQLVCDGYLELVIDATYLDNDPTDHFVE